MDEIDPSKEIDSLKELEIDLSKAEVRFLGRGSFCDVHLVEIHGRLVAVKTLRYEWTTGNNDDFLRDLKNEYDTLCKLKHLHIITTIGCSEKVWNHQRFQFGILTEWCEMGTLRTQIFNVNFLYSMQNVTKWSENLFDALDYMFQSKHIHRDIKTENIFLTKDFIVKLGDFGTTRKIDPNCTEAFDVGTLRYRSPPQPDPTKTEEQWLEQSRKDSSRNDVYALGLVIWQLIERRPVFGKYDTPGYDTPFDDGLFLSDIFLGKLKGLDPPKCIQEIREIVKSCCDFDRSKRPYSEEILKRLKEFNKDNLDLNDGYPKIDENQQRLIRPIGFDQLENRKLIRVTSHKFNSFRFGSEPSEKHAEMLMKKYSSSETIHLRKEFDKRFNETSNHENMDFISETKDIIVDAIDGNYKYFHEYFHRLEDELSYLEAQLLKEEIPEKRRRLEKLKEPLDKMNIKEIFKEVVVRRQNQDMHVLQSGLICYGENSVKMSEATKFPACLLFYEMKHLDMIIKSVKKKIPFSNLKFKCFLSSQGEEWILIGESFFSFVFFFFCKSFDKFLQLPKERCFENETVLHSIGDGLLYFDDFIIKKTEFVQLLERTKLKNQIKWNQNYCLSSNQTSETAQEIEMDFPIEIKGRPLFQLSKAPGIHCSHEPKCDMKIGGSNDRGLDIPYFPKEVSNCTEILDFYHWDIPESEIQRSSDPIVLLQVEKPSLSVIGFGSQHYITLFDFSDEYFEGPNVPCLDYKCQLSFIAGPSIRGFFSDTPKNKRRYLVATPIKRGDWNLSVLDYQGKEIKEVIVSDSESESDSNSESESGN